MAYAQGRPLLGHAATAAPFCVCGRGTGHNNLIEATLKLPSTWPAMQMRCRPRQQFVHVLNPFDPFSISVIPFSSSYPSANPIALFRLSHWMAAWKLTKMAAVPHSFALIASQFFRPLPRGCVSVVCQLSIHSWCAISSDHIVFLKMSRTIFQSYQQLSHSICFYNATNMYSICSFNYLNQLASSIEIHSVAFH